MVSVNLERTQQVLITEVVLIYATARAFVVSAVAVKITDANTLLCTATHGGQAQAHVTQDGGIYKA